MEKKFSDMLQDSAKGSFILILGQMSATFFSAIGTIIIARILGSTSFGMIAIAQIPIQIAMMTINNGVNNAIIYNIAENLHHRKQEKIRGLIYAGFAINLSIGLFISLILYTASGYLAINLFELSELESLIQILSFSILAQSMVNTGSAVLVGFEKMGAKSQVSIINSLAKSVIGPVLVYLGYGAAGAAFGYTLPFSITGLFAMFLALLSIKQLPLNSLKLRENIILLVRYAYPLFFSNLFSGSLNQVLRFVLPFYASSTIIGNYSAAINFSVLIGFFLTPLNTAIFPLFSKIKREDGVLEWLVQDLVKYESLLVFPIASGIILFSNHLVQILYGTSYEYTPLFMKIQILNYFFVGIGAGGTLSSLLNSQKKTTINFRSTLIYLIIGVPMAIILVPKYGVIGLQITTLVAPKMGVVYCLWWLRKNYDLSLDYNVLFKIVLSTIISYLVSALLVNQLSFSPLLEIMIGGLVLVVTYLTAIIKIGALTKSNIRHIHELFKGRSIIEKIANPVLSFLEKVARYE